MSCSFPDRTPCELQFLSVELAEAEVFKHRWKTLWELNVATRYVIVAIRLLYIGKSEGKLKDSNISKIFHKLATSSVKLFNKYFIQLNSLCFSFKFIKLPCYIMYISKLLSDYKQKTIQDSVEESSLFWQRNFLDWIQDKF